MTQRDAFFGEVVKAAYDNPNIVILSADSGALVFDQFRKDRPQQWIHMGIAEANMACVAAGLAIAGKQVFMYAIIPFVTGRCFDQLKVAIALRGLPVTIVGVGAGYSYDNGGPTHYGVEDIGAMKQLKGLEIISPYDETSSASIAFHCLRNPAFRYVRLDRHVLPSFSPGPLPQRDILIITYGAMIVPAVSLNLYEVLPITQIHPWPGVEVRHVKRFVIWEEHFLTGGLGEAVAAKMADDDDRRPLLRIGIPDQYEWENGSREHLWRRAGIDAESVQRRITEWLH